MGYWHPAQKWGWRSLPADWAGQTSTSLVSWAPVGCLHDAAGGSVRLGADEPVDELEVRYGVSEEHKNFAVELHGQPAAVERRLGLLSSRPGADPGGGRSPGSRAGWPDGSPPSRCRCRRWPRPVYSTWYTFTQDMDADVVEAETAWRCSWAAARCSSTTAGNDSPIGRGYAGCGDWVPDTDKFPDLVAHVGRVHDQGAGVVLWIAPLLLGRDADVFADLGRFAPTRRSGLVATSSTRGTARSASIWPTPASGWSPTTTSTGSRSTSWIRRCATGARRRR